MIEIGLDAGLREGGASSLVLGVWTVAATSVPVQGAILAQRLAVVGAMAAAGNLPGAAAAIDLCRSETRRLGRDPDVYPMLGDRLHQAWRRGAAPPSISPLDDLAAILSIRSGWAASAYDADELQGAVMLRLGGELEVMPAASGGLIELHRLPVLADAEGPFGCPLGSHPRTAIGETTKQAQCVVYSYDPAASRALARMILEDCASAGLVIVEPVKFLTSSTNGA